MFQRWWRSEQDGKRLPWRVAPPCRYVWGCWRPGCVYVHDEGGDRQEHVRDLAELWARAAAVAESAAEAGPLEIAKNRARQKSKSQSLVEKEKLGFLGPEQRPQPPLQQSQSMLVMLGLVILRSTVPRLPVQQLQSLSVKLGLRRQLLKLSLQQQAQSLLEKLGLRRQLLKL